MPYTDPEKAREHAREYRRRWKLENPEKYAEQYARQREKRKTDEFREKRRATRDLEKSRAECRAYYQRNIEAMRQRGKEYNAKNSEKLKETRRTEYERKGKQRGLDGIKYLSDNYIRGLLAGHTNLKQGDIPQEMVDVKRLQIEIRREYLAAMPKKVRQKMYKETTRRRSGSQPKPPAMTEEQRKERQRETARVRYDPVQAAAKRKAALDKETPEQKEIRLARQRAYGAKYKEATNAKRRNRTPEERAHVNALARAAVSRKKLKQLGEPS